MVVEGESGGTAIAAKALEEVTTMEMTTAVCKVDSVLILKMYFMPMQDGKGANKSKNCEKLCLKRACTREERTRVNGDGGVLASSSPWSVGVGKNLVVRK
jgi:hypothetical protein